MSVYTPDQPWNMLSPEVVDEIMYTNDELHDGPIVDSKEEAERHDRLCRQNCGYGPLPTAEDFRQSSSSFIRNNADLVAGWFRWEVENQMALGLCTGSRLVRTYNGR